MYVSWDDVWTAADVLLLGAGAPELEGVDSRAHVDEFLESWQEGALPVLGEEGVGEERCGSGCESGRRQVCGRGMLAAHLLKAWSLAEWGDVGPRLDAPPRCAGKNGIQFSRGGMAFDSSLGGWGNLRYTANAAFIMAVLAKQAPEGSESRAAALQWATGQVDYIMGSSGRSYICGFGYNPPVRPHHAAASCPDRPAPCDWEQFDSPGAGAACCAVHLNCRQVCCVVAVCCVAR